jgi:hypothetical protein
MNTLNRKKLDGAHKARSIIFGWREQFTPGFVGRE